jgi:hypothetical protein
MSPDGESMIPLNDAEIQDIATAAADAAVRKVFLTMGYDLSDPKAVLEMQSDFRDLRSWRKAKDRVRDTALTTAIGVLITGALGWLGLALFQRGGH